MRGEMSATAGTGAVRNWYEASEGGEPAEARPALGSALGSRGCDVGDRFPRAVGLLAEHRHIGSGALIDRLGCGVGEAEAVGAAGVSEVPRRSDVGALVGEGQGESRIAEILGGGLGDRILALDAPSG